MSHNHESIRTCEDWQNIFRFGAEGIAYRPRPRTSVLGILHL